MSLIPLGEGGRESFLNDALRMMVKMAIQKKQISINSEKN
jgi:hypothetical protein